MLRDRFEHIARQAYDDLAAAEARRRSDLRTLRAALERIRAGAQSNAGRCQDCDSVARVAEDALMSTTADPEDDAPPF